MRRQAQALSVSPATMLRLARAAGYNSYDSFRAPFQLALASAGDGLRQSAAKLNAVGGQKRGLRAHDVLAGLQRRAVQSACSQNTPARFDEAVQYMLPARLGGFLGSSSDRKRVVTGKSVSDRLDLGGCRTLQKNKMFKYQ